MNLMKETIHIVSTGGTIEKIYDEKSGVLGNQKPVVHDVVLSKLRLPHSQLAFHNLMAKDSLEMGFEDRKKIFDFALELSLLEEPIVILHGTDTLHNTFSFFDEQAFDFPKPVVFTGAMKPVGFSDSDALQNLTEALLAAKILSGGVYLSFHNQVIKGSSFRKDKNIGSFVSLDLPLQRSEKYM